jgi:hypothetical protein
MEPINRVPTRMRDKLLATLADPTAPKEHQKFAAKVLQYYGEKDSDPKEDTEVRRMLAEIFSGMLWSGASSLIEESGKLVYSHHTVNPNAPEYRRGDGEIAISTTAVPTPPSKADEPSLGLSDF